MASVTVLMLSGREIMAESRRQFRFSEQTSIVMTELVCLATLEKMGRGLAAAATATATATAGQTLTACEKSMMDEFPELEFAPQHLNCGICLEFFHRPVSLECGHRFCRECLHNLLVYTHARDLPGVPR